MLGNALMRNYLIKKFKICHQIPERSFHYKNKQFPVCARCTGILLGYCTIPLFYFGIIQIPPLFIILLDIPLLVDSLTQYLGLRESNNMFRLVTGVLSSFACSAFAIILAKKILMIFS